jgi:small subunit ribosomal protein S1
MSDEQTPSFADLFEAQAAGKPKGKTGKPQRTPVQVGSSLEVIVVQVGKDAIFCDLGDGNTKRQAYMDVMAFEDGEVPKEGDRFFAKVVSMSDGMVRLAQSMGRVGDASDLLAAKESGLPIEGKVTGANKGGLEVDLGKGMRGFCPMSQIALRPVGDAKEFIGQSLNFAVIEVKDGGKSIVLSRRSLLEGESREASQRVLASLEIGKLVRGTITAVRDFGAFVDIGGFEALLPASELSHDRRPVSELVQAGSTVEAQVLDIKQTDPAGKERGQPRVTLSLKALTAAPEPTPGMVAAKGLRIGAVVTAAVTRIEAYGVFVQVAETEGRDGRGLIPSAELNVPRGADLRKLFPEGNVLSAKILETGAGKLKLSIKAALGEAERVEFESHREKATANKSLGTLGDLFSKIQLSKKK